LQAPAVQDLCHSYQNRYLYQLSLCSQLSARRLLYLPSYDLEIHKALQRQQENLPDLPFCIARRSTYSVGPPYLNLNQANCRWLLFITAYNGSGPKRSAYPRTWHLV